MTTSNSRLVSGLSLEEAKAEHQYLQRELGVLWTTVTAEDFRGQAALNWGKGRPTALIVSDPSLYPSVLHGLPRCSIVVILLSDEAYSQTALDLAMDPAVGSVFRNYSIDLVTRSRWLAGALQVFREGEGMSRLEALRLIASGASVRRRIRRWGRLDRPVFCFPLGYTASFADSVAEVSGVTERSATLATVLLIPIPIVNQAWCSLVRKGSPSDESPSRRPRTSHDRAWRSQPMVGEQGGRTRIRPSATWSRYARLVSHSVRPGTSATRPSGQLSR